MSLFTGIIYLIIRNRKTRNSCTCWT